MVIYLRDKKGIDYFEVEFYETSEDICKSEKRLKVKYTEVHASVYSNNCFKLILSKINDEKYINKFIEIFEFLEELRGWYYEVYLMKVNNPSFSEILEQFRGIMNNAAKELELYIVED